MKVKWLILAAQDLEQAEAYIAQENPTSAVQVVLRIIEAVDLLADQPGIGRPGRIEGTRELVVEGTPFYCPLSTEKCLYRNSSGLPPVKMLARRPVIKLRPYHHGSPLKEVRRISFFSVLFTVPTSMA